MSDKGAPTGMELFEKNEQRRSSIPSQRYRFHSIDGLVKKSEIETWKIVKSIIYKDKNVVLEAFTRTSKLDASVSASPKKRPQQRDPFPSRKVVWFDNGIPFTSTAPKKQPR